MTPRVVENDGTTEIESNVRNEETTRTTYNNNTNNNETTTTNKNNKESSILFEENEISTLELPKTIDCKTAESYCRSMVDALNEWELDAAARTSYQYFIMASIKKKNHQQQQQQQQPSSSSSISKCEQKRYALRMARRFLIQQKGDEKKALTQMKQTLKFRDELGVDDLRCCYDKQYTTMTDDDDDDDVDRERKELYAKMRKELDFQFSTSKMYVRGYDTHRCVIHPVFPRHTNSFDPEWYVKAHCFMLERGLACSERASGGRKCKVNVLIDYNGYRTEHNPSLSLIQHSLNVIRDNYPEVFERVVIVDAPFIFRAFWAIIRPFVDPLTKKTIFFVTGEEQKREIMSTFLSEDQAEPFMIPEGKLISPIDMKKLLYQIPFDHAYDEH